MKNILVSIGVTFFMIGCTDYPDVNITIDQYYPMQLLTKDEAKTVYQSAMNSGAYGNFNLVRFGYRKLCTDDQGVTSITCDGLTDENYYNEINASDDYYIKIDFDTDKNLHYIDGDKYLRLAAGTVLNVCTDSSQGYTSTNAIIESKEISAQRYHYTLILSIPVERGLNLSSSGLWNPTVEDICLEIDTYYFPAWQDIVRYTSNRVIISASDIQAVLDQMPWECSKFCVSIG